MVCLARACLGATALVWASLTTSASAADARELTNGDSCGCGCWGQSWYEEGGQCEMRRQCCGE